MNIICVSLFKRDCTNVQLFYVVLQRYFYKVGMYFLNRLIAIGINT